MKQRVSRRNRRTASTQARHTRDLAILAISLVIFIGGSTSLAGALHSQPGQADEPARSPSQRHIDESSPYTGIIMPGTSTGVLDAASETDDVQELSSTTADVPGEPALPTAAEEEGPDVPRESSPPAAATPQSPRPTPSEDTRQGYVVHHTAYREQPVYRTVHHQASTAREVTVAGKTRVEWTSCPVCGQRHASPYNERVLDHVTGVPCAACGGVHDADYDETVYE